MSEIKTKLVFKQSYGRLLLVAMLLCSIVLNVDAQVPKKKGAIRRSITSEMPGGYTQVGTTDLIYSKEVWGYQNSAHSIDIRGKFEDKYYGCTYSDRGYELAIKVGDNAAQAVDCNTGSTVDGVSVTADVIAQSELGRVCYYVTNTNAAPVTISLGIHADVMIGSNDAAPIIRKKDSMGNTYGLALLDGNGAQLCVLFGNGLSGVTGVSDFWFGNWSDNSYPEQMVGNYNTDGSNWMVENGAYDSGMGWCWKGYVIPAGETMTFSWLIGVGDVSLEPYSNYTLTLVDPTSWNDLTVNHALLMEGEYESPAGLTGRIEYAIEDSETWTAVTGMLESGSSFTGTINALFNPALTTHTIRLRTVDQVGNTTLLKPVVYKDVSPYTLTGIADKIYTGEAITQTGLTCDMEAATYSLVYNNNVNVGTATLNLEGLFPYSIGRKGYTFEITPQPLAGSIVLSENSFVYNGQPFTPSWNFSVAAYANLVLDTDYTLAWTDNLLPGTGTLTITGIGNYTGTLTATITIDKAPITADSYTLTLPVADITYDGLAHGATVTTATGVGAATISYTTKDLTNYSATQPTDGGNYDIYLEIAESALYYGLARTKVFTFSIYQFDAAEWAALQTLNTELIALGCTDPWDMSGGITTASTLSGLTIEEGHVIGLDLSGKNLTGAIPASIVNLPQLQTLNISNNKLTGNIASTANSLTHLTSLDASNNCLDEVNPKINPSVTNVNLEKQTINQNVTLNIANLPTSAFVNQIPNILLYNHAAQSYANNVSLLCTTADGTWSVRLDCQGDQETMTVVSADNAFRGASGDVLKAELLNSDGSIEGSSFNMPLTFAQGDVNFDGAVDVLDVQAVVNYIFDNYSTLPFNYTAANMWADAVINIQDVVSLVNKLFESAPAPMAAPRRSAASVRSVAAENEATLTVENGNLILNSSRQVAVLDITLSGTHALVLSEVLKQRGLICESRQVEDGVRLIAYSLSGGSLSAGETIIGKVSSDAEIVSATLGDSEAVGISVGLAGKTTGIRVTEVNQMGDAYLLRLGHGHAISIDENGKKTFIRDNRNVK